MDFANSWPNSLHLCLYTLLIILSSLLPSSTYVASHVSCLADQSSSLLQLKSGFIYSDLTSWQPGTDCCRGWEGVSCNEATRHVTALDISNRDIKGNLSAAIFNLSSLQHLNLAYNDFSQNQIPAQGFEKLTMLTHLNLSNTNFSGQIPIAIANLTNLISLDLSCDDEISDCDLKQHEPNLQILVSQLSNLRELYLDDVDISENGTEWCRALSELVPHLQVLSMVNCNLSGPIDLLGHLSNLTYLFLTHNQLTGEIPSSMCQPSFNILDLSYNNFSVSIPSCIIGSRYMKGLGLRGNKLSGILSPHISRSCALVGLDLNNNNLEGNFPRSLTNCKDLAFLDIGNNRIGGTFPSSLARLQNLQVIILRSNRFHGTLGFPSNFGKMNSPFPLLRIIDLASNNFNGSLPPLWFNIFKSMQNLSSDAILEKGIVGNVWISVTITDKGEQMTLVKNLPNLMMSIDLSTNRFTGDIPQTIGELKGIKVLNLSHNAFTGSIPHRLGRLTQIESLDLSWNQLSGEIPQELISLTSLSILNLSFNHLVGRIPQSKQFLTFENSSFEGNPGLCGMPLSKLCNIQIPENNSTSPSTKPAKKMTAIVLLCLFIGLGFGTGFAVVIVIPVIKRGRNEHATR